MSESEVNDKQVFRMVLRTGEQVSSCVGFTGTAEVYYSNGDKYDGELVNGVN